MRYLIKILLLSTCHILISQRIPSVNDYFTTTYIVDSCNESIIKIELPRDNISLRSSILEEVHLHSDVFLGSELIDSIIFQNKSYSKHKLKNIKVGCNSRSQDGFLFIEFHNDTYTAITYSPTYKLKERHFIFDNGTAKIIPGVSSLLIPNVDSSRFEETILKFSNYSCGAIFSAAGYDHISTESLNNENVQYFIVKSLDFGRLKIDSSGFIFFFNFFNFDINGILHSSMFLPITRHDLSSRNNWTDMCRDLSSYIYSDRNLCQVKVPFAVINPYLKEEYRINTD